MEDIKKATEKEVAEKNKAAVKQAEDKKKHEEKIEKDADKIQKESTVPVTETVAKTDAATDEAIAQSEDRNLDGKGKASGVQSVSNLDLAQQATVSFWTVDEHKRPTHPNDVKVKIHYPAGYKGDKTMEDGSIHVVSSEVADHFEELGIGKRVK